jgi:hypothetical protein
VDAALGAGRAVLFTTEADTVADVTVRQDTWREDGTEPEVEVSEVVGSTEAPPGVAGRGS